MRRLSQQARAGGQRAANPPRFAARKAVRVRFHQNDSGFMQAGACHGIVTRWS
jgi:hypothetical protein